MTLFDSQNRYRPNDKFFSNIVDGASITYSNVESTMLLTVSNSITAYAGRESRFVFTYQPGKSLLIMNTFVMDSPQAGLVQRVGYYGTDNGYFLEISGSSVNLVERSNLVDTKVAQSVWNVDRMDGTGPSRVVLDLSKSQILFNDVEWLGVGSVRIGFVIDGILCTCHVFHHANRIARTYMTTACLPVRYEIYRTNSDSPNSATLKQICSTVISEGGYEPREQLFIALGPTAGTTLADLGVQRPLCTIRLAPGRLDAVVRLKQVCTSTSTNNDLLRWTLVLNGTLTGATFAASTESTNVSVDTAATAVSGGRVIETGFAQTGGVSTALDNYFFEAQLGRNSWTQTSDTLTLCATGLTLNAKVFWTLAWSELI